VTAFTEGGAAARIAVELGHHHAVEGRDRAELPGHVDRVLARHRIDDEQDAVRRDRLLDRRQLGHQLLVDVQAARGVDDQDVLALLRRPLPRPRGDFDGVGIGAALVDVGAGLRADLDELLDGRGTVDVAGRHGHGGPVLGMKVPRQLGGRGRLSGALQTGHQDHGGGPRREGDPGAGAAHQRRQLLVDDLDHLLAGVQVADDVLGQTALLHR
jgi:hypothetical protein